MSDANFAYLFLNFWSHENEVVQDDSDEEVDDDNVHQELVGQEIYRRIIRLVQVEGIIVKIAQNEANQLCREMRRSEEK